MTDFVSLTSAHSLPGLRLAMVRHVPSPWSQAAKGIFEIKRLPFVLAAREADDPDPLLREWTGQESFPVVAYESERPRTGWAEILFLAERLAPSPALIPPDPERRTLLFGLAHEICGEMGLGWCGRLLMIAASLKADPENAFFTSFGAKYGYSQAAAAAAPGRFAAVLRQLDARLAESRAAGGRYLLGTRAHRARRVLGDVLERDRAAAARALSDARLLPRDVHGFEPGGTRGADAGVACAPRLRLRGASDAADAALKRDRRRATESRSDGRVLEGERGLNREEM